MAADHIARLLRLCADLERATDLEDVRAALDALWLLAADMIRHGDPNTLAWILGRAQIGDPQ